MKLQEAKRILNENGYLCENRIPVISLDEFNRQVHRRDKGWVIGKLNNHPSAPWTLTKAGIGQIRFSVCVHSNSDNDITVDVRGLGCEPEEGAFQNINKIYNDIFGVK